MSLGLGGPNFFGRLAPPRDSDFSFLPPCKLSGCNQGAGKCPHQGQHVIWMKLSLMVVVFQDAESKRSVSKSCIFLLLAAAGSQTKASLCETVDRQMNRHYTANLWLAILDTREEATDKVCECWFLDRSAPITSG